MKIILQLGKNNNKPAICVGWRVGKNDMYAKVSVDDMYNVYLYETQNLELFYQTKDEWDKITVRDAISKFYTILNEKKANNTPHDIKKCNGNESNKQACKQIAFEELLQNVCLAASESFGGAHARDELLKSFLEI